MKLTLTQFIAFGFVLGWVLGEVARASYSEKLMMASLSAFIAAYLNNAHGLIWGKVKSVFKKG